MSSFLLDTNIPSEMIRTHPDPGVNAWVLAQDEATLHLSVVTIGASAALTAILGHQAMTSRTVVEWSSMGVAL